jgi:hypothetical protein
MASVHIGNRGEGDTRVPSPADETGKPGVVKFCVLADLSSAGLAVNS